MPKTQSPLATSDGAKVSNPEGDCKPDMPTSELAALQARLKAERAAPPKDADEKAAFDAAGDRQRRAAFLEGVCQAETQRPPAETHERADWQTEAASKAEAEAHASAKARRGSDEEIKADWRRAKSNRRRKETAEAKRRASLTPQEKGAEDGARKRKQSQQSPLAPQQDGFRQSPESQAQMRLMRRAFATPARVFGGVNGYAIVVRLALGVRALEARASTAAKLGFGAALGRQGKPPAGSDRRTNSGGFREAQHQLEQGGFIERVQTWFRVKDADGVATDKPGFCKDFLTPKAIDAMAPLRTAPTINGEAVRVAAEYRPPETCTKHGEPAKRGRGKRTAAVLKKAVFMQLSALCDKTRCTVKQTAATAKVAERLGCAKTTVERAIRALMAEGHVALVAHPGAADPPKERALKLAQAAAYCAAKAEAARAHAPAGDEGAPKRQAADAPEPSARSP